MPETNTDDAVLLDTEDEVATITLNQPGKRNALSPEIMSGFKDALDASRNARCVVVTGSQGVFCAGGDISGMGSGDTSAAAAAERITDSAHDLIEQLAEFPVPVIAKIDGPAFGAGGAIALACDIRVASTDAQIGFGFRQVGLTVDSGVSHFLPRLVGRGTAKELVFTGKLIDAETAAELGLFEQVYEEDFDARVNELATGIATGPTAALRHSKRLIDNGEDRSLRDAMQAEATAQATLMDTHDHDEGVEAFFEDRNPDFKGE